MRKVKYILSFVLSTVMLVSMVSCKKEISETPSHDPNKLPPLTHEGKNTFGCLVNGEVWVAYAPFSVGGPIAMEGNFNDLSGNFNLRGLNKDKNQTIHLWLSGLFSTGVYETEVEGYDINELRGFRNNSENSICLGEGYYNENLLRDISITFLNKSSRIISGIFEMDLINPSCSGDTIRIREGRFDWRY